MKKWKPTKNKCKMNSKKMEDELKKDKKWKTIGCDVIVN
jgi:hypothetical protein